MNDQIDTTIPANLVRQADKPATTELTTQPEIDGSMLAPPDALKAKPDHTDAIKKAIARRAKKVDAKAEKPAKVAKVKAEKPAPVEPEPKVTRGRSIVPLRFKEQYAAHNDTNGSKLALALKSATTIKNADGRDSLDVAALRAIAEQNAIDFGKYEHLNNGQKRMNVGNKLAGLLKNGEKVTVGTRVFANATAALAKPTPKDEPAQHASA